MGNEQANSMLGDDLPADNVFQASGDDNASEHADKVFGEEPNVADIDDAGPQISRISYVDGEHHPRYTTSHSVQNAS